MSKLNFQFQLWLFTPLKLKKKSKPGLVWKPGSKKLPNRSNLETCVRMFHPSTQNTTWNWRSCKYKYCMTTNSGHVTKKYYLSVCIQNQNLHRKELQQGSTFGSSKELVPWFSSSEDSECRTSGLGDDSPESRTCDLALGSRNYDTNQPQNQLVSCHLVFICTNFIEISWAACLLPSWPYPPLFLSRFMWFITSDHCGGMPAARWKLRWPILQVAVVSSIPACATREP